jgi:ATP-dependent RNA helicase DDX55/SPB4
LAFLIPMIEIMLRREIPLKQNQVGCLVISPTRELARQIFMVAEQLCKELPKIRPMLFVGGTDVADEETLFLTEGCQLLVATPGRLLDAMKRLSTLDTRQLEVLVLDEADVLLDMGFEVALTEILRGLPKQRRTGLFSATQTKKVAALARAGLRNPAVIKVRVNGAAEGTGQSTPSTLKIFYMMTPPEQKLSQLIAFMQQHRQSKMIIFFTTCACVEYFTTLLRGLPALQGKAAGCSAKASASADSSSAKGAGGAGDDEAAGVRIESLHGRMVPKRRQASYQNFLDSSRCVLLCTDVAARGIDIPDVDWIVQYDPPTDPDFFIHRVGRTARAGRVGGALSLLLPSEDTYVHFLSAKKVPIAELPMAADAVDVLPQMKKLAVSDRDVLEKGTRAFVSFIRAYKEHQCQFIFRFTQLDLGAMARAYALLQMPHMKEVGACVLALLLACWLCSVS